jgi:hypothetical protein
VTALVAAGLEDIEALSPELVLVSPPELAARARALLSPFEPWRPRAVAAAAPARRERLPFAVFCSVCAAMTLLPLTLVALLH